MGTLILVRHAETELNAERRYQGRVDPPLSERGRCQARQLGQRLARTLSADPAGHASLEVHSSVSDRAKRTAAIALPGWSASTDSRLAELDFGVFEGRTYEENLAAFGDRFRAWIADPEGVRPPGGETLAELRTRVHEWLDALPDDRTVIAFTHGGPIRVVLARLLDVGYADTWELEIAPCDAFRVRQGEPAPRPGLPLHARVDRLR
jgi:broad specificity phosphatase PhoE